MPDKIGDSILVELVAKHAVKLSSLICNKIIISVRDTDTQLRGLEDIKTTLEAAIDDAVAQQPWSNSQRDVIVKVEAALEKITDFLDEKAKQKELMDGSKFTQKVRIFFSSSNPIVTRSRDVRTIKAITKELTLIGNNHSQFGTILGSPSVNHAGNHSEFGTILASSSVNHAGNHSQFGIIHGSSSVNHAGNLSQFGIILGSSSVNQTRTNNQYGSEINEEAIEAAKRMLHGS